MLDIRIPIGLMFSILGAILAVFGLVSDPHIYDVHSFGINVNLGLGMRAAGLRDLHADDGLRGSQRSKKRERLEVSGRLRARAAAESPPGVWRIANRTV